MWHANCNSRKRHFLDLAGNRAQPDDVWANARENIVLFVEEILRQDTRKFEEL